MSMPKEQVLKIYPAEDLPDFRVFKRDVTGICRTELVELCGGRVFDIYVFDASRYVFACELTPSYELHWLCGTPGGEYPEDKREEVDEQLREANLQTEPVIYIHVSNIDLDECLKYRMDAREWIDLLESHECNEEKAHEAALETVIEYYQGNPEW